MPVRGNPPWTVAIALFDGVDDVGAVGPALVFKAANLVEGREMFRIATVTAVGGPVRSLGGIAMVGDYTVATAPAPDILVLPGAMGTVAPVQDASVMEWIDRSLRVSHLIITVCTGIRLLSARGLAADLDVTSHPNAVQLMKGAARGARVHDDMITCDNGRILTSSRLNGGIEAALQVVRRLRGLPTARKTADLIEYEPVELEPSAADFRGERAT